MGKKVGPLPLWALILIIVIGTYCPKLGSQSHTVSAVVVIIVALAVGLGVGLHKKHSKPRALSVFLTWLTLSKKTTTTTLAWL